FAPAVVVAAMAADVDHRVERAATAQHLAPGPVELPAGEVRLRLGGEVPVERAPEQAGEGGRDADLRFLVFRAGLEQQHPAARILAEPPGQDTAGAAGPDNDEVEVAQCHVPSLQAEATGFLYFFDALALCFRHLTGGGPRWRMSLSWRCLIGSVL